MEERICREESLETCVLSQLQKTGSDGVNHSRHQLQRLEKLGRRRIQLTAVRSTDARWNVNQRLTTRRELSNGLFKCHHESVHQL